MRRRKDSRENMEVLWERHGAPSPRMRLEREGVSFLAEQERLMEGSGLLYGLRREGGFSSVKRSPHC